MILRAVVLAAAVLSVWLTMLSAQVTFDRILHADREPENWLTYSGNLGGQRHSLLAQITPGNVKNLELKWVWQAKSLEKFEATPLVVDGVMYTVEAPNNVVALDAVTGRPFWTFPYTPSPKHVPCCGRVNRGLAMLDGTLFMGTLDAHLIAIDAATGVKVWNTAMPIPPGTESATDRYGVTGAPLVVKDKVIVGTTGGVFPTRGFVDAYDAKTGKQVWRFYTIPGPGERGQESWPADRYLTGGGATWNVGAYDPQTNLVFWGVGNPYQTNRPDLRVGDNLYSCSVIALDADTGQLKRHYQFTPHDDMDWDSTQVPVLADMDWQGKPRKVMLWANRNGVMYVLDRVTGEFLKGQLFSTVNWLSGFDEKGRPMRIPTRVATKEGTLLMPTLGGATNWYPPSYSPRTGLFYISAWENTSMIGYVGKAGKQLSITGLGQTSLMLNPRIEEEGYGVIRAFDPKTGEKRWEYKLGDIMWAGVLTTESDLLFGGGREGHFFALDARKGDLLWKASVGGQVSNGPISYAVNGTQYVTVAAGAGLFTYALR